MSGQYGNSNHSSDEADIKNQAEECEKGDTTKTAGQNYCENGVEHGSTGKTFNSLVIAGNVQVAISENGQEVRVNS